MLLGRGCFKRKSFLFRLSSRKWLIQEEALFREETVFKEGVVFRKEAIFGKRLFSRRVCTHKRGTKFF
jgi:hypothetical protein